MQKIKIILTTYTKVFVLKLNKCLFSCGVNLTPHPPPFKFQEKIIQQQYHIIELLNNLFHVG